MQKDKMIVVGDNVDLISSDNGIPYRTVIEEIQRGGLLCMVVPSSGGFPMLIHVDEEILLAFYRESGRYTVRARVVAFDKRDELRFVYLVQLSEPVKDQRRKYYRLPVSLNAILCEYIDNIEDFIPKHEELAEAVALEIAGTKDLSITGIALVTKHGYRPSEKYILKLFFEHKPREKATPFVICAEVMRSEHELKSNLYRVGMRFFGQTQSMSEYLARYVLKQQQRQIVQRRLVEGE